MPDQWVSQEEAAKKLGVHRNTISNMLTDGRLEPVLLDATRGGPQNPTRRVKLSSLNRALLENLGHCVACNDLGWVFDRRPSHPDPMMLEFMPCLIPDCPHSGRPIQNICFHGIKFTHASMHPKDGYVMSISGGAE